MQVTINFTDDELPQARIALASVEMHGMLVDLDERLRGLLKHGGIEQYTAETLAEEIRSTLSEWRFICE